MVSPLGIPQYMPNAGAAAVSMKHHLQGQSYGIVSACASGAHAIGSALRMIQYGDADAVVLHLDPWDTASVPADAWRSLRNVSDVETEVVVITAGDGRKTPDWAPDVREAVAAAGRAVDKSGLIAPAHLLPGYALGRS